MSTTADNQTAEAVATRYFDAVAARDLEAMGACWAPHGVDHLAGQADMVGPEGVRGYFSELFAAFPDFAMTRVQTVVQGDHVAVSWRATGTFMGPGSYHGIQPTGARIELEGADLLRVEDGLIVRNDAFTDGMTVARQLGLMPPKDSPVEQRMTKAFNARTRLARRLIVADAERIADGVWLVRGGLPIKGMNVYLLEEEGGGVCLFDAGIADMARGLAQTAGAMGGITRIVLGHAHADHRGAAAPLGAPVYCHSAEKAFAEGDGGFHTFDLSKLRFPNAQLYAWYLKRWDGGPVKVAGTFEEGDEVAPGFKAVHVPGHSPGMVALFRERDGLALSSDTFYTVDAETLVKGGPRLPHAAFTPDVEQARASIRKLAALRPSAAWPGHAKPITGDVAGQLEKAASG